MMLGKGNVDKGGGKKDGDRDCMCNCWSTISTLPTNIALPDFILSVKADLQSKSAATPTSSSRPNEPSEGTTSDHTPSEAPSSQEELKSPGVSGGTIKPATSTAAGGDGLASSSSGLSSSGSGGLSIGGPSGEPAPIRAPASLWRCSRIMHLLRDLRPTLLSALEGIVDQVSSNNSDENIHWMYTIN